MIDSDKIANVYAQALLELARDGSALQDVGNELKAIVDIITADEKIWRFFHSPLLNPDEKFALLQKVFKDQINGTLYNFIGVLTHKRRLSALPDIYRVYVQLLDVELGQARVAIQTSVELAADLKEKLKKALEGRLGMTVILETELKPEILGGIVIRSKNLMIDTSVKTGLERMRRSLLKRKILGEEYYEN